MKKVLIVDDDLNILKMFKLILTREGYDVTFAENGKRALEIAQKDTYPMMFIDLQMPEMNGMEFCRKIRNKSPFSFLVAMTGLGRLFEIDECRSAGFDDYLRKPLDLVLILKLASTGFERFERWKKL